MVAPAAGGIFIINIIGPAYPLWLDVVNLHFFQAYLIPAIGTVTVIFFVQCLSCGFRQSLSPHPSSAN
jgi:hypothetical protein